MSYEYKAVGGPERGRRRRGAKTRSDRVAVALEEIIAREAIDGWQYLRTDLIPVEERRGWLGRVQEIHRSVMVFRRELTETLEIEARLEEVQSPRRSAARVAGAANTTQTSNAATIAAANAEPVAPLREPLPQAPRMDVDLDPAPRFSALEPGTVEPGQQNPRLVAD
ncbi:MAG: hypothetical protein AAGF44_04525 [Pseudomonadota bacterium]